MGSISGFKEYVDKKHPACPLCGGATEKKREKERKRVNLWYFQECLNCGAQHDPDDGEILRGSN